MTLWVSKEMIDNLSALYSGKVVVVTGGGGYVGSALIHQLRKYNCKVIRTSRHGLQSIVSVEDKVLDLTRKDSWIEIVSIADIIFHLAGNTSIAFAEENIEDSLLSNLAPITNLVLASKKLNRCPKVIYASTATVYGMTGSHPIVEETLARPVSIYDLHKLYAEQYLTMASDQGFITAKSLRLANVYGPSLSESSSKDRGILSKVTKICLQGDTINTYGGGDYLRDYIFIDDVVKAFLCVGISYSPHTTLNVASGIGTTVKEVFQMVLDEVEQSEGVRNRIEDIDWPPKAHMIDQRNFIASNDKLKSVQGWDVTTHLKMGIRKLVKHYS